MKKGHYCKICGEYKANEKFSGKGHAAHICKECARLPVEKRNEIQTINRLMDLPFRLSREQRGWLEKMRKDERENVRSAAEWAWASRFAPVESVDDEELEELGDLDDLEEWTDETWDDPDPIFTL